MAKIIPGDFRQSKLPRGMDRRQVDALRELYESAIKAVDECVNLDISNTLCLIHTEIEEVLSSIDLIDLPGGET